MEECWSLSPKIPKESRNLYRRKVLVSKAKTIQTLRYMQTIIFQGLTLWSSQWVTRKIKNCSELLEARLLKPLSKLLPTTNSKGIPWQQLTNKGFVSLYIASARTFPMAIWLHAITQSALTSGSTSDASDSSTSLRVESGSARSALRASLRSRTRPKLNQF